MASFWRRLRAWLAFLWNIETAFADTQARIVLAEKNLGDLAEGAASQARAYHEDIRAQLNLLEIRLDAKIVKLGEDLPSCACLLDRNRSALEFLPGVADQLQVEVVSADGQFKFVRPLSHPDVAECLQRDDFICRKVR